jgi:hypothetical protein
MSKISCDPCVLAEIWPPYAKIRRFSKRKNAKKCDLLEVSLLLLQEVFVANFTRNKIKKSASKSAKRGQSYMGSNIYHCVLRADVPGSISPQWGPKSKN